MTLFIKKKMLKLVGVVALAVGLAAVQLVFDPIGHYQQAVATRAELIRQQLTALQQEVALNEAKDHIDNENTDKENTEKENTEKEVVSKEQSSKAKPSKKDQSKVASTSDALDMVEEAGEHIVTTAKAIKTGFFTEFRLERDRVRDQQLQLLKELIANPKTGEKTRHNAQDKMLVITQNLGKELEVENLIKAKNYDDAVVFLREESAVVVIKAKKLQQDDVAKIADLVKRSAEVKEDNVVIIPKE